MTDAMTNMELQAGATATTGKLTSQLNALRSAKPRAQAWVSGKKDVRQMANAADSPSDSDGSFVDSECEETSCLAMELCE